VKTFSFFCVLLGEELFRSVLGVVQLGAY